MIIKTNPIELDQLRKLAKFFRRFKQFTIDSIDLIFIKIKYYSQSTEGEYDTYILHVLLFISKQREYKR